MLDLKIFSMEHSTYYLKPVQSFSVPEQPSLLATLCRPHFSHNVIVWRKQRSTEKNSSRYSDKFSPHSPRPLKSTPPFQTCVRFGERPKLLQCPCPMVFTTQGEQDHLTNVITVFLLNIFRFLFKLSQLYF